jgi:transcriptional regulator with XRE-family HTH domain
MTIYGRRIQWTREALGLSVRECCEELGLAPCRDSKCIEMWERWESGEAWPDLATILAFCSTYDITLDWLMAGRLRRTIANGVIIELLRAHPELLEDLSL